MKYYHLFLDDERYPTDCCLYMPNRKYYWETRFVVVRNYDAFVKTITTKFNNGEFPVCISLDHDLSDIHYTMGTTDKENWENYNQNPDREYTGYDCAKWLTEFCGVNNLKLPEYFVHSMNTIGRKNINSWFENYKKHNE